jgi:iron(III) transport system permease protein
MGTRGRRLWFAAVFALVFVVGVLPLLLVVRRAFADPAILSEALSAPETWRAALATLRLSGGTALLATLIGAPLAWLVTRTDLPRGRLLRSLLTLPYVIPPYVAAVAWINLASPRVGVLNRLFGEGTFDVYSMGGLTWVMGLSLYPYVFLTVAAALENADPSLEDAARMSGAGTGRVLRDVALPIMLPAIFSSGVLVFLASASAFGAPVLIGGPARIDVLSTLVFDSLWSGADGIGRASSQACVLFAFVLLPLAFRATRHAVVTGKAARPSLVRLGRMRGLVFASVLGFVAVAVLLPGLSVAVHAFLRIEGDYAPSNWTLRNFALLARGDTGGVVLTSLLLGIGAAALSVVLGGAVAFFQVKSRLRGRSVLAAVTALPLATPGTVLALGLILLWMDPFGLGFGLTNTVWILLVAYVARFGALAARAMAEGFGTIDDVLPEAARVSGARGFTLLRTIWIPLVLPSITAGFFLVFMPAFSELTMSVLLVGPGVDTVGTRMFELMDYEAPTAANVLATVVLALVIGSNWLLRAVSRGRYGI